MGTNKYGFKKPFTREFRLGLFYDELFLPMWVYVSIYRYVG